MSPADAPGWLSILPALVTIGLALATRQVLPALFAGIVTGSLVLFSHSGDWTDLNFISRFLLPSLGSASYANVLLIYLWCLGGLIGVWERTGSARHFAEWAGARIARTRESSLLFTWLLGVVFHQGGTVSTVLTGSTAKPVADGQRVSHEELAYVVDSTSSPIATLIPFNAWPAYVAGLAVGTIPILGDERAAENLFFDSIVFNFYALFAVGATLLVALGKLPWIGATMKAAKERTLSGGPLDRPGSQPLIAMEERVQHHESSSYRPSLLDFFLPLGLLLAIGILPKTLGHAARINEAFFVAVFSAMVMARLRGMPLLEVTGAFVDGCKQMTIGAIILGLAVTVGNVSKEVGAAPYLVGVVGTQLHVWLLPGLLTVLCMTIAFATGTSWGTYAVVFPIALPVAWSLAPDPLFIRICFGAVLGGAVFGDQCSPISDTTVLSSMFTGCDLIDHVRTQLPLSLTAAGLGALCSMLAAWLLV